MIDNNISTELIYLFVFLIISCIIYSIYNDITTVTKKKNIKNQLKSNQN